MNDAPLDDQALEGDPMAGREVPVGPLLVASLGWLLAFVAVMALRWPLDPSQPTTTGAHLLRFAPIEGESALATILRGLVNAGVYVILIFGIGFLLIGWFRAAKNALPGLAIVGGLGLLYVSGMALYTGPMIAVLGFTLILFSALIGWSASLDLHGRVRLNPVQPPSEGYVDNATHSPA